MRAFRFILLITVFLSTVLCQSEELYFPTGTVWKEVVIDPEPLDTLQSNLYEIGSDTIINNNRYKCVLANGNPQEFWVREQDGIVWVLSDLFPSDIKIYDFNWDGTNDYTFEYLSVNFETGNTEVKTCHVPSSHTCNISYNGESYWYIEEALSGDVIVNKIGRVRDLNLNCAMLGCIMYEPVLPGLIYSKVLWVKRNEETIYETQSFENAVLRNQADLNNDSIVDISDVNAVINVMLGKSAAPGDVTGDGTVDISDVNAVINAMLGK